MNSHAVSPQKAVELAVRALEREKRLYAFDATLAAAGSTDPAHMRAAEIKSDIEESIRILRGMVVSTTFAESNKPKDKNDSL